MFFETNQFELERFIFIHCDSVFIVTFYKLSNITPVDEKLSAFHKYLRYGHTCATIAFSMPSAII